MSGHPSSGLMGTGTVPVARQVNPPSVVTAKYELLGRSPTQGRRQEGGGNPATATPFSGLNICKAKMSAGETACRRPRRSCRHRARAGDWPHGGTGHVRRWPHRSGEPHGSCN